MAGPRRCTSSTWQRRTVPQVERRRAAESLGAASQYVTNYLTHHFLAGVSEDMELLLRRNCLFDVLTPSRCDALLERRDSRQLLQRLEQLGVVSSEDGGATVRAPEVLRQYFVAAFDEQSTACRRVRVSAQR